MPRPRIARADRRTARIMVRLTAIEAAIVRAKATRTGRPVAVYLRELALSHTLRTHGDPQTEELIRAICRVGNQLEAITGTATGASDSNLQKRVDAVLDELFEIATAASGPARARAMSPATEARLEVAD